ncbi:protein kinase [Nocardia abscessus]|uniref:serine/threonine-protein kinase n=1 Tax=Nocardia abscessus TaxID=120957 RepID=UPI001893651C|nr:serine/threonine-protein kinase [Nocardia abscessus]MBF6337505.1 protein kinase [Nocardia abscessus]
MDELWFGHYRLDRLLGSGGTGEVWLAHDTTAGRTVALKVLAAGYAADTRFRQRFTREARLAAQVRGPHLVSIHSFGELDGRLYIDMEYIEGSDVAALLRREGRLAPERAIEIVSQTATALDIAHRAGLVHRDVKPSNIMVTPDGTVYLIDFGTAHRSDQPSITATGNVVGTLAYMAPERFDGTAGPRSDQYSLACVLYECLTGRRPFDGGDPPRLLRAHLMQTPPLASALNPAVPPELDAVIARGMAKDPARRWSSAGELASVGYAAVTGRDATTVELSSSVPTAVLPPPRWRARTGGPPRARASIGPRLALAAFGTLAVAVAGTLWLGRPEVAVAGPDDSPIPSSKQEAAAQPVLPSHAPAPPVPISAPLLVLPGAGQPCDPAVDVHSVTVDGLVLTCTPLVAGRASWLPAVAASTGVATGSAEGDANDSGQQGSDDKRDRGKPGHSNQGNGRDKPKPNK